MRIAKMIGKRYMKRTQLKRKIEKLDSIELNSTGDWRFYTMEKIIAKLNELTERVNQINDCN
jgi:hypothetical protein